MRVIICTRWTAHVCCQSFAEQNMRITIKEIARELGLSHSNVSRVLNEKQSALVSEPTRRRIMETADRMGYRPSRLAQALQGSATRLIGLFLPAGRDHFFNQV